MTILCFNISDKSQATGQQQEKHEQLDVTAENNAVEQGEPKDEESAAVSQQAPETETIEGQQEEAQATEEVCKTYCFASIISLYVS